MKTMQEYYNNLKSNPIEIENQQIQICKILKIKKIFNRDDPEKAIKSSKESYGIGHFDNSEIERKKNILNKSRYLLLDEGDNLWYTIRFHNNKGTYRILHKFSWHSCLHNGSAAMVYIDLQKMEIHFSDYKFNRDALRTEGLTWTTCSY